MNSSDEIYPRYNFLTVNIPRDALSGDKIVYLIGRGRRTWFRLFIGPFMQKWTPKILP